MYVRYTIHAYCVRISCTYRCAVHVCAHNVSGFAGLRRVNQIAGLQRAAQPGGTPWDFMFMIVPAACYFKKMDIEKNKKRLQRRAPPVASGCWLWTGPSSHDGYGHLNVRQPGNARQPGASKKWRAHRLAWTVFRGPIPEGLTIDHLCKNKLCVNPEHLEPCTMLENLHRHTRPHGDICKLGLHVRLPGTSRCGECHRATLNRWYHRHKGQKSALKAGEI